MDEPQQPKHTLKIDIVHIIIAVAIIAVVLFFVFKLKTVGLKTEDSGLNTDYWTEPFPFGTDPNLHWHAYPSFKLCGEDKTFLQVLDMAGAKFVNGMAGPHVMHVHEGEPWFHIESPPPTRKDITLGKAFKNLNIKFSNKGILTYDNSAACNNGKENSLKVSVNGEHVDDPENHVLANGEKILIEFD